MGDIYIKTSDLKDKPSDASLKLYVYRKETVGTNVAEAVASEADSVAAKAAASNNDSAMPIEEAGQKNVGQEEPGKTPGFSSLMALFSLLAILFARRPAL